MVTTKGSVQINVGAASSAGVTLMVEVMSTCPGQPRRARGRHLGARPAGYRRPWSRRCRLPQGLGAAVASLASGMGIDRRRLLWASGHGVVGAGAAGHFRCRSRPGHVAQGLGTRRMASLARRLGVARRRPSPARLTVAILGSGPPGHLRTRHSTKPSGTRRGRNSWYPSQNDWESLGGRFISQPPFASWVRDASTSSA